jgi:2-polyprenyl-3-methyl-5-hydroxy-6-metoxy-1,4-benzoquinol methylase
MEPFLSSLARRWKLHFFAPYCTPGARILEVGSGSGWCVRWFRARGFACTGLDLCPPADIVGDIRDWKTLGLQPESFDVVIAFELLEHVDCLEEMRALLKPEGLLMLTTPVPRRDALLKRLERRGLLQTRTSAHSNLREIRELPGFRTEAYRRIGGSVQWGVYRKHA